MNADLHMHSCFSNDGEFAVSDIISQCLTKGLKIISLTDHNCVRGIASAMEHSSEQDITVIPGIEIDCNFKGIDLHVLGYNIDWDCNDFLELEEQVNRRFMDSFPVMINNLSRLGIVVDPGAVLARSDGKPPTAELIAEVLIADPGNRHNPGLIPYFPGGDRSDMPYIHFYHDFFAQGKPAYVKVDFMSYEEAIQVITVNEGTPVIAHPGINLKGQEQVIHELLDIGAAGLEVFNNYHNYQQIEYFAKAAIERKSLMTCGSDFHGKTKPLIGLGEFKSVKPYEDHLIKSINELISPG